MSASAYVQTGAVRQPGRRIGQAFTAGSVGSPERAAAAEAAADNRFSHKPTRTITIDLATARTAANPLVVDFNGSFIHVPWSTNSDDLVMVKLDDDSDAIPLTRHYSCSGNGYRKLTFTNEAIAGATMYVVICQEPKDERLLVL